MDKNKSFTIILFLGLLIAIPVVTGILQNQDFEIRISALQSDQPQKVLISDVKDDSFKVTWMSEKSVLGGVELANGSKYFEESKATFHSVEVKNLSPEQTYTYSIISDSKPYSDPTWPQVKTAGVKVEDDYFLVYGQVFSPDGYSFQQEGVVSMELVDGSKKSQKLTTLLNETGGYQFNLANILKENLQEKFDFNKEVNVYISSYISYDSEPIEKVFPMNFSQNRQIPNIYLGEVNIDVIPAIDGTE